MVTTGDPRPIGIFDSGLGGLTVARGIMDVLPSESIVYFGDTARFPYGTKTLDDVYAYADQIIAFLCEQDVKMIVVGCNSASSALWQLGRPPLDVPILGVIDPPAHTAVRLTRNGKIGIIGTDATIGSGQYAEAVARTRARVETFSQACPRFVAFAENGTTVGKAVLDAAQEYLEPLKAEGVDTVILGCTHYPLLTGTIQYVMGPDVLLVSSAAEVAKDAYTVLMANNLLAPAEQEPAYEFYASGSEESFTTVGHRFCGPEIANVKRHPLGAG